MKKKKRTYSTGKNDFKNHWGNDSFKRTKQKQKKEHIVILKIIVTFLFKCQQISSKL